MDTSVKVLVSYHPSTLLQSPKLKKEAWVDLQMLQKELNENLKCIARAGAGTNNIPVEEATEKGIVVFNTPGANSNAVKELVLCGMLLASRGIIQGNAFAKSLKGKNSQDLNALMEKHKKEFKGKGEFIYPFLNTKTTTVTLRGVLNNKDDVFKPGMFVIANIEDSTAKNDEVLTIPSSSVLWTGERSVVYLKTNPDQTIFEMREIKLGNQIGNEYEVLEGLFVGNEIVTNGTFTVDAAAQLQGKKSLMNKDGGKVMTGHEGHLGMDNNSPNTESDHTIMNERLKVSAKFQEQLKAVFNAYINLKDALVKEDSKGASESVISLLNNLTRVDMKLLSNNKAHNHWMSLEKEIKPSATSISETSDIKAQRDHFKYLSSHLINAVQLFGVNEKVYVEFCPMADNNNGAYWLSKEEKVINPYFGSAMLTCGEVKQVIE